MAELTQTISETSDVIRIVENATVTFVEKDGRGVLVPGGLILTAAHCLDWSPEGGMCLEDSYQYIKSAVGVLMKCGMLAVEPVADIAVLGVVDEQKLPEDAEAFEDFVENTEAVPLFDGQYPLRGNGLDDDGRSSLNVLTLNSDRTWVRTKASIRDRGDPRINCAFEAHVKGGASGGPIITPEGELVAVVSHASVPQDNTTDGESVSSGYAPRVLHALPVWIVGRLKKANQLLRRKLERRRSSRR